MRKRFLLTLVTLLILGGLAAAAVFLAKGYRLSPENKTIFGTGILSLTSTPDQASVYIDGHLTTATNANVNSLEPRFYEIKIVKDGFIPWQKKIEIKQGLVTEVKATLFPAIPSIYPLSFNGALNLTISPDNQRVAFLVPGEGETNPLSIKKGGIWVWDMKEQPIAFARGREPHQILAAVTGLDLTKASFRWAPDSNQLLVSLPDKNLLLDANRLNDPPKDITAILKATLSTWDQDMATTTASRVLALKDLTMRREASEAAYLKWSPDETKLLYSRDGETSFKVIDLTERKSFDLSEINVKEGRATPYMWLADSRHLILTEVTSGPVVSPTPAGSPNTGKNVAEAELLNGTISVLEYDGTNTSILYAGKVEADSVFSWPDGSRLIIVSSIPTPTASQPNLYGLNLK
ncbi:hypothetical protein A2631_01090 [Candidatus Daviesbacteria bacterium RIFCSPHIGHO2_01_FULL_44_29]|uniref:PEGA domain-containing protein n=1 Tax=Candidatus Daviesbacteria bacterium RIFCSPHIGHO2_02_FULL_43_12 TaxID=1797776 RepID=A0A1F5KJC8_9BACT|nr:MAG: hypothetical protein A2631_01090 [Candidatus Daviesbacteria bacterium RIFCSPHIGHO2_01_FULL_44_29]OGE40421.1 MAG: hypothetical protein A3E86_03195 [Candidatus Daviesbacteria bacterium RIFCSPHIGHO2_12_FULL_47_45]OGE40731.1 MAG: hypothetical protein A3D25_05655 [Candidatus Daviesbacteria bacterium RIFCSPHIGHO2_02_FULL_43_12]OGE69772.1 MAG: hypothetical protein A3B55_05155 [Candidatus Daviesbacteria bacterium RIFCSPLOWO2_01_FULL_43_15]